MIKFTERNRNLASAKNIIFPVYKLPKEPFVLHGIVFSDGIPIDDRNVEYPTLGMRRLKSKQNLGKLSGLCHDFPSLIKRLSGQENWFIDPFGNTFQYIRTSQQMVRSHKIIRIEPRDTYSLVHLDGVDYPFIEPRPPKANYARVLYYKEIPWIILNFEILPKKVGTKKV